MRSCRRTPGPEDGCRSLRRRRPRAQGLAADRPPRHQTRGMVFIGYHASHEQVPPSGSSPPSSAPRRPASTARCARTTSRRGASRQGESGYAWSWLGAALASTSFSLGVVTAPGQRYHPVITRAGDRHPRGDVPRPILGGARQRRGHERARHRRRLAAEGPTATRDCTRSSTSSASCSPARRSRATA